jgi:hypothetical protein
MTRHDTLQCVHEPFGDAYYFGPERLAERYENDPKARKESGYEDSTYRTIFDRIARENSEVRLLILFIFCSFSAPIFSPRFSFLCIQSISYFRNVVNFAAIACCVFSAIHSPVTSQVARPYNDYPTRSSEPILHNSPTLYTERTNTAKLQMHPQYEHLEIRSLTCPKYRRSILLPPPFIALTSALR